MTDTVAVALITAISTALGLCLKRWWDNQDHRRANTVDKRAICERHEYAWHEVSHFARSLQQSICMLDTIMPTNADYAKARLTELAHEAKNSQYLKELRKYVDEGGEKPSQ